ncbi:GspE/PulE family protein [Sanyastnella coralliicola]|uniref:GspE/PulE family protein n=1 Tax=Sanyastnella coralliicola TaxID=3069118 RepID=UPI0027BAC283|nr:GspE/PulE family protein [Longitalea sp. SCSIO 12813]
MELKELDIELRQAISSEMAWEYRMVPKTDHSSSLEVYSDTLGDKTDTLREVEFLLGKTVEVHTVSQDELMVMLSTNYGRDNAQNGAEIMNYSEDFLVRLVQEADQLGSSDIHIEVYEHRARVRMRVDGHLLERHALELRDYPALINKIKVQSKLDISEKRRPQDGRIAMDIGIETIDLRVSIIPTLYGEKSVLRLLQRDASEVRLDKIGLAGNQMTIYMEGIQKPQGIVLISGPTGSGKTTTLYASLRHLNQTERNVITVEDPIEYTLEGINQLQLNEAIGLTFAKALRAFLRQDPDVIMLGEIRDKETAEMAVRASLTGHLVFSTIHTQSAWGTIDRLMDMGVPSYMISSTLNLSVAQRLVRKLCNNCKQEVSIDEVQLPSELSSKNFGTNKVQVAKGCPSCFHTGYKGRAALFEIIPINESLRAVIREKERPEISQLKEFGFKSLKDQAIELVSNGTTSVEETFGILSVNSF